MITQKDIEILKDIFVTKDDIRQLKNEIFEKIDKFLALFMKVDQEQTLMGEKVSEHTDTLESHDKRIGQLEHSHHAIGWILSPLSI